MLEAFEPVEPLDQDIGRVDDFMTTAKSGYNGYNSYNGYNGKVPVDTTLTY